MDRKEELQQWLLHANNDFRLAQHGLSLRPMPDEPICCLSQQAAEKFLKAFLFLNNIEPPKTHDLPLILEMCEKISPNFSELSKKCFFLTKFAVAPRYPNELQITEEDAKLATKYAKEIKEFVEKICKL
ncbi:MAG: HEPN domain-containing protein [Chitinivibrionia bacterium]|nr:HEPN domain-containing protein [Chitinivibrionia bacterium]